MSKSDLGEWGRQKNNAMFLMRDEKLAIVQALDAVLMADGVAKSTETQFMGTVLSNFSLDISDLIEAKNMDITNAAKIIRAMSKEKKDFFKGLLASMALADGDLHIEEHKILSLLFALLN